MRPSGSVIFAASAPLTEKWEVLGPVLALTVLAIIFVALRWYSRVTLRGKLGLDDYIITVALAFSISIAGIIAAQLNFDRGRAIRRNDWEAFEDITIARTLSLIYTNNVIYQIAINLVKASIVIQFLRIFLDPTTGRYCYAILVLLLGAASWGVFGGLFQCWPVQKYWHPWMPGRCIKQHAYWYSAAGVNILMDVVIWLLPMPFLNNLRLPTRQKVGLIIVFAVGGFVCIVSVLRLLLVRVSTVQRNYTESGRQAILWSAVEVDVSIICACMMALKPLFQHHFPHLMEPKKPARHSMRLPTIMDDPFWGTTMTTSARRNSKDIVTPAPPYIKIEKVTTMTLETREKETEKGFYAISGEPSRVEEVEQGDSRGSARTMGMWA